ncbi:MAG: endo alpha-1,4 polygalactosaminidase [Devosiaceae bacterium]|nr:endo alpha-1,4 polygalactosaminidase [Devosiaceae bacterium]
MTDSAPPTPNPSPRGGRGTRLAALLVVFAMLATPTLAAPAPGASWDWQLSEAIDPPEGIEVFDADPDNVTREQIMALNEAGVYTICYISVGTMEDWRDDAAQYSDPLIFPNPVVGKAYEGWPGEFFLDIRQPTLRYVMQRKFNDCRIKGFQAVEPDNMDVYTNDSGFDLTAADTVRYVAQLVSDARAQGLEIGQKNTPELTGKLVSIMDFIITEDCYADGWCDDALLYIAAGKPVFNAEYTDTGVDFAAACAYAAENNISMIRKDRDLTVEREVCN